MRKIIFLFAPLCFLLLLASCTTITCEEPPAEASEEMLESIVPAGGEMTIPDHIQAEVVRLDDGRAQLVLQAKDGSSKKFRLFICDCLASSGTCEIASTGNVTACLTGSIPCTDCEFVEVKPGGGK